MQLFSLLDDRLMDQHAADERKLKAAVQARGNKTTLAAWDTIAKAEQRYRDILIPYTFLEGAAGLQQRPVRLRPADRAGGGRTRQAERDAPARIHRRGPAALRDRTRSEATDRRDGRAGATLVRARADARVSRARSRGDQGGLRNGQRRRPREGTGHEVDAGGSGGAVEAVSTAGRPRWPRAPTR